MEIVYEGLACYNVEILVEKSFLSEKTGKLILETNPLPEYYSRANFPPSNLPKKWRLFLMVDSHMDCFQDHVLRYTHALMKSMPQIIELMPGQITMGEHSQLCVRVNTSDLGIIDQLILELQKLNIKLAKNKKFESAQTVVFYKRYTEFVKINDGVYRDSIIHGRYFFEIDHLTNLKDFNQGIKKIKNSCNFHLFDSFLSTLFIKGEAKDFIGIYSEHCDENRFGELKKHIEQVF